MNITKQTFPIEVQNLLARLLASENIKIRHSTSYKTAFFDLKNRTLHLPVWKDCSEDVLSFIIGHEVGHALYTPPTDWMGAVKSNSKLKDILNIVEDSRIERMIKIKFPGLRPNFNKGYKELFDTNFFGAKDAEGMGFLDRLNFHSKLVSSGGVQVKVEFNETELGFVKRTDKCLTFQDCCGLANDIYNYLKENQEDNQEDQESKQSDYNNPSEFGDDEFSETESGEGESDNEEKEDSEEMDSKEQLEEDSEDFENDSEDDSKDESEKEDSKEGDAGEGDAGEGESDNEEKEDSEDEGKGETTTNSNSPENKSDPFKSLTQQAFDSGLENLTTSAPANITYATIEKIEPGKFILDYKEVHRNLTERFSVSSTMDSYYATAKRSRIVKNKEILDQFKRTNEKTISYMVKEFEMKKSATLHAREQISRTGVLNTNKIYSYKYNEDVFKKITKLPNGKNHGLVMFIDMSASMSDNMTGTIEQLMTLVSFCRKVQIPFEVYGFTNNCYAETKGRQYGNYTALHNGLLKEDGELLVEGTFRLKNYFSSKMNSMEFSEAMINMMYMANCYRAKMIVEFGNDLPVSEQLNQTPLAEAILVATKIVTDFKNNNRLDIVNTVFLTDGGANGTFAVYAPNDVQYLNRGIIAGSKLVIHEKESKRVFDLGEGTTKGLIDHLKKIAGVNVIGFYIYRPNRSGVESAIRTFESCQNWGREDFDAAYQKAKENSFHVCKKPNNGFTSYYLIAGEIKLSLFDEEELDDLEFEESATKNKIRKAFQEILQGKMKNRVILSKFIENIA